MPLQDMALGDAHLDADHEQLEEHIRALLAAPPEEQLAALTALRAHAAQHFATEDEDLRQIKGGNASCHLDEHASVLKSLDEVAAVLEAGEWPLAERLDMVFRLGTQLLSWLPYHVQEMDAGVVTWRARQKFGGAPVQIQRRARD